MKLADIEWGVIKRALGTFVATLVVGAGAVYASESYLRGLVAENNNYQNLLNQMRSRFNTAMQELELVRQYWPEYKKLEAMGFVGEENRLNWVDMLRQTAERDRVLGLHYEVRPQAAAALPSGAATGEFQLNGSEMFVRLNLIHEGNWLDFLRDINHDRSATFNVKACSIERMQEAVIFDRASSNFAAQCRLIFYTIQPRQPSGEAPK